MGRVGVARGAGEAAFEDGTVPGSEPESDGLKNGEAGVDELGDGVGAMPRISAMASADACSMRFEARCRCRDLQAIRGDGSVL